MENTIFEQLYNDNKILVYRAAYDILKNKQDAEDVVIEVFCKLYNCLTSSMNIHNVKAWLLTVVRTTSIDYIRKYKKYHMSQLFDIYGTQNNFTHIVELNIFLDKVLNDIYNHNPEWYELLTMYYLLGMSQQEIATALGISLTKVQTEIYRTKRYLKRRYKAELPDYITLVIITFYIILRMEN